MQSVHTFVATLDTFVDETPAKGGRMGDISVRLRSTSGSLTLDMPHDVARELYVLLGSKMDEAVRQRDPARQPY